MEKMKQQLIGKYMQTQNLTKNQDPTFPPKRPSTSRVGRTTKGGKEEERKAMNVFIERWLSQGSAGQGAQPEPDTRREAENKKVTRTQESGGAEGKESMIGGREHREKEKEGSDRDRRTDNHHVET